MRLVLKTIKMAVRYSLRTSFQHKIDNTKDCMILAVDPPFHPNKPVLKTHRWGLRAGSRNLMQNSIENIGWIIVKHVSRIL